MPALQSSVASTLSLAFAKNPRVLWVDDHPRNNSEERSALRAFGARFRLATSTEQALQILERSQFAVVVSDMARGEDKTAGYSLLYAMRSQGNRTPFIIYAASMNALHIPDVQLRGAQACTSERQHLIELVLACIKVPPLPMRMAAR
jgi:CheY-like chemotaxis protein